MKEQVKKGQFRQKRILRKICNIFVTFVKFVTSFEKNASIVDYIKFIATRRFGFYTQSDLLKNALN